MKAFPENIKSEEKTTMKTINAMRSWNAVSITKTVVSRPCLALAGSESAFAANAVRKFEI
jgi:hypothetical protein